MTNETERRRAPRRANRWVGWTLGCCLLVAAACGESEPEPVRAARVFIVVLQASSYGGDLDRLLPLLERRVVEELEQSAQRASDQVGGRRSVEAQEMLQVVDVDPTFQVASAELLESTDTTARVRLVGADGSEHTLRLVFEEGAWRVSIPMPTGPAHPSDEPSDEPSKDT